MNVISLHFVSVSCLPSLLASCLSFSLQFFLPSLSPPSSLCFLFSSSPNPLLPLPSPSLPFISSRPPSLPSLHPPPSLVLPPPLPSLLPLPSSPQEVTLEANPSSACISVDSSFQLSQGQAVFPGSICAPIASLQLRFSVVSDGGVNLTTGWTPTFTVTGIYQPTISSRVP